VDHFFVSHSKVRRFYEAPPGVDLDAVAYVQPPGAVKEGTPFFLDLGLVDPAFRGRSPLRNSAAGELAITTGMRLREFSCLLDIEVGPPRRDASPAEVMLQAIAKFGLPRMVAVQHATLREIDLYRRTERAAMVRSSLRWTCTPFGSCSFWECPTRPRRNSTT
jgi:hypothetical protein